MSEDTAVSVIHRKAQAARDGFDAREMSPAKALRLALAKSAARLMGLALAVRTVEQTTLPLSQLEDTMGDDGLLILLDGPDQALGAMRLDLQMVAALIEMQLKGRVMEGAAEARPFTHTDAAIAQPLINAVLDGLDETLKEAEIAECARGFRFGDRVADARSLALALSEPEFDHFRLNLDLAGGAKPGVLDLVLPKLPSNPKTEGGGEGGDRAVKLEQNALNAPVTLDAVLGRMRVPLQDVCDWTLGTILPLSHETLIEARLLAAGRHLVAHVKLGQLNGFRAVRLVDESAEREYARPELAAEEDLAAKALDSGFDPLADVTSLPSLEDNSPPASPDIGIAGIGADLEDLNQLEAPDLGMSGDANASTDTGEDINLDGLLAASVLPTPAE